MLDKIINNAKINEQTDFVIDYDSNHLLLNELLIACSIDDEVKINKLLNLNLDLETSFVINKEYELSGDRIEESSDQYPSFLAVAFIYVQEKHLLKIINKFNYDAFLKQYNPPIARHQELIVEFALKRDCLKALGEVNKKREITEDELKKVIFNNYGELRKYGKMYLENGKIKKEEINLSLLQKYVGYAYAIKNLPSFIEDLKNCNFESKEIQKEISLRLLRDLNEKIGQFSNSGVYHTIKEDYKKIIANIYKFGYDDVDKMEFPRKFHDVGINEIINFAKEEKVKYLKDGLEDLINKEVPEVKSKNERNKI